MQTMARRTSDRPLYNKTCWIILCRLSLTYLQDSGNVKYSTWKEVLRTLVSSWLIELPVARGNDIAIFITQHYASAVFLKFHGTRFLVAFSWHPHKDVTNKSRGNWVGQGCYEDHHHHIRLFMQWQNACMYKKNVCKDVCTNNIT